MYTELKFNSPQKTNNLIKKMGKVKKRGGGDKVLEWTFLQRKQKMAKKHTERCSTLLTIREMQIKTTMRYHLTPMRMTAIKNQKVGVLTVG